MMRTRAAVVVQIVLVIILAGCAAKEAAIEPSVPRTESPVIRVLLVDATPEALLLSKTSWVVETFDGSNEMPIESNSKITVHLREGSVLLETSGRSIHRPALALEPVEPGAAMWIRTEPACVDCRRTIDGVFYEGRIEVFPAKDGMVKLVLVLPMEEYLRGVVPSEIGPDSPLEAMCAQAVAARSEAFVALTTRKYAGDQYDICSDVGCQVFSGNARRSAESDDAVRRTRGQILLFDGKPISAYYASNCGGHTEDIRNVWPDRSGERAYWEIARFDGPSQHSLNLSREKDFRTWMKSSPSVFCNPDKYEMQDWAKKSFRWSREVDAEELSKWVARKKDIGRVTAIRPVRRGVSGRMIEAEFVGERGTMRVGPELQIRRLFSPSLRSAAFVVDPEGPKKRPDRFILHGAGSGHGVGMCQTGAIGMANDGKTFLEILEHYYPKASVVKLY